MKGHTVMYVILALMAVLLVSRAASAAGLMLAGGNVLTSESQVLTGQFAQSSGNSGQFSFASPGGQTSFNLG